MRKKGVAIQTGPKRDAEQAQLPEEDELRQTERGGGISHKRTEEDMFYAMEIMEENHGKPTGMQD